MLTYLNGKSMIVEKAAGKTLREKTFVDRNLGSFEIFAEEQSQGVLYNNYHPKVCHWQDYF
jgi:hypothetical protein